MRDFLKTLVVLGAMGLLGLAWWISLQPKPHIPNVIIEPMGEDDLWYEEVGHNRGHGR